MAKKRTKKEKVCEVFKVEKKPEESKKSEDSKEPSDEKIVKSCGTEEEVIEKEGQVKKENKILKKFLIGLGIISFIILLGFLIVYSARNFEYRGMTGNVVKEGDLIFYQTSLPVLYEGKTADYNFYMRNDPRKLDSINFDGEIVFLRDMVVNITEDFNCEGDGVIGIANLVNLYKFLGTNVIKDENATCDSQGRYMFIQIQPGEVTNIEQFGPACYNLNVNNCEILKVTERFMFETFVKVNEMNNI